MPKTIIVRWWIRFNHKEDIMFKVRAIVVDFLGDKEKYPCHQVQGKVQAMATRDKRKRDHYSPA
jgi:hypothetical protein